MLPAAILAILTVKHIFMHLHASLLLTLISRVAPLPSDHTPTASTVSPRKGFASHMMAKVTASLARWIETEVWLNSCGFTS